MKRNRLLLIHFWFLAVLCTLATSGQAQVFINEVCSKNVQSFIDSDGDSPDWIELYNAGSEAVDLSGYFISDNEEKLEKWSIENAQIDAGGYLLILASGKDRIDSEYHTNFKISSDGETVAFSDPEGELIHRLVVPLLRSDHSIGYYQEEPLTPVIFESPTPGTSNNISPSDGYTADPEFMEDEAFFSASAHLTIKHIDPDAELYYTLNGGIPSKASERYIDTIQIDTTTVVRVRAYSDGRIPSNAVTQTFFIRDRSPLAIFSLSTNPGSLWDQDTGIYVFGPNADSFHPYSGANFWNEWERQIHLEMFLPNGDLAFSEDLGVRMHGGGQARTRQARPFRILAKQEFGASEVEFKVFEDKPMESYDRLVLRNSGSDFNKAHFRDGVIQRLMIEDELDIDLLAYRPVILYLNARYWGVYNLRERYDDAYIHGNHPEIGDLPTDILEQDFEVINGDSLWMRDLWNHVIDNDMADDQLFARVIEQMDLSNVADYFIAETYLNNRDWPNNNLRYWRPRSDTGQWRYMLFDLDVSLNKENWANQEVDNLKLTLDLAEYDSPHAMLLENLLENEGWRHYFISRYADLINTTFRPERFQQEVDEVVDILDGEMPRHFKRWPTYESGMSYWYEEIEKVRTFVDLRPFYARKYVQQHFELENQVELQLNVSPPGAGTIKVNTVTPKSLPWDGIYYNGVPVTLTIEPAAGYNFSYWQSTAGINKVPSESITHNFETDDQITAYFEERTDELNVNVYPNPSIDEAHLSFIIDEIEVVEMVVFSATGSRITEARLGTFNAGLQEIVLSDYIPQDLQNGVYWVTIRTSKATASAKFIRIISKV